MCCREARKLLKTIVAPPTVKPLAGILNEYVELKEADSRRKQLVQSNPVVSDLLAVIENHAGNPPKRPAQACKPNASLSTEQVTEPQLPASDQPHETEVLPSEPSFGEMVCMTADYQHAVDATPAQQPADVPAARLASSFPKMQSSSQHRKGAPRRRTDQSDRVSSPISRLALSSLGAYFLLTAASRYVQLPYNPILDRQPAAASTGSTSSSVTIPVLRRIYAVKLVSTRSVSEAVQPCQHMPVTDLMLELPCRRDQP